MESTIEDTAPKVLELSFPFSQFATTRLSLRLTLPSTDNAPLLLLLSTSSNDQTDLGSLVYGLPPRTPLKDTLSTALYSSESSIEFTTRLTKALVRRTKRPVYVGAGAGFDGPGAFTENLEHEVKMLKDITNVVMNVLSKQATATSE